MTKEQLANLKIGDKVYICHTLQSEVICDYVTDIEHRYITTTNHKSQNYRAVYISINNLIDDLGLLMVHTIDGMKEDLSIKNKSVKELSDDIEFNKEFLMKIGRIGVVKFKNDNNEQDMAELNKIIEEYRNNQIQETPKNTPIVVT